MKHFTYGRGVLDAGILIGGGATLHTSDADGVFQFTLNLCSLQSGQTRRVIVKAVNDPLSREVDSSKLFFSRNKSRIAQARASGENVS